jgi:hypothetical protein
VSLAERSSFVMKVKTPYPLSALRALREKIKHQQSFALSAALRVEQRSRQQVVAAEQELKQIELAIEAESEELLRQHHLLAHQAQTLDGYRARLRSKRDTLRRRLFAQREELARAANATLMAKRALEQAEAEVRLVEQHEARWTEARLREAAERAEQELEDLLAARGKQPLP